MAMDGRARAFAGERPVLSDEELEHTAAVIETHMESGRRVFVTATAVRALAAYVLQAAAWDRARVGDLGERLAGDPDAHRPAKAPAERHSPAREAIDTLVRQAAVAAGLPPAQAREAVSHFAALTCLSLDEPSPWPAEQLSSLSGGAPFEFSAVLSTQDHAGLRYAVEVGSPYLPPGRRALSGVAVLGRVARRLGYESAWQRIVRALTVLWRELHDAGQPIPPDLRFGIWGGIDMPAASPAQPAPAPRLKVYVNLLHTRAMPTLPRLLRCLDAAGIPCPAPTHCLLQLLAESGIPQELGFRMGPGARWDCKVYFELPGWQRSLAGAILERLGAPDGLPALVPDIPGVLRESLASKERSGISLRLDTASGAILDVTTAAAFPPPMLSPEQTRRRVLAWAYQQGWVSRTYASLSELLLAGWRSARGYGRVHSLFTRTLSRSDQSASAAIYLRPYLSS